MNKWQKAYLRGAYRGKSPGALYRERLGTVQDALDWIDDGDCLTWSTHGSEPKVFLEHLHTIAPRLEKGIDCWNTISRYDYPVTRDPALAGRYPRALSGGQRQRVGIARALAAGPELLLMDEPFGAVDEITRGQLQDEFLRIHRESGITVLFVTHDIAEALKLGTRTLVMDAGQIQQYDAPSRLLAHPATSFVERLVRRSRVFQTRA